MGVRIIGTGSYLPEKVVYNDDIESTSSYDAKVKGQSLDEWVRKHHGAISRHVVEEGEATSDLALKAAKEAINDAGIRSSEIDLIILSTFTGDHRLPQAVGHVQANVNPRAKFFQIDAACSGFIDGAVVACSMMKVYNYKKCLLIGAESPSFLNDPQDFLARTVFGDGAGAVVLVNDNDNFGFKSFHVGSDGNIGEYVLVPAGGSRMPFNKEVLDKKEHFWKLKFSKIAPWALDRLINGTIGALDKAGLNQSEISWVVPHQASIKIIEDFSNQMEIAKEKYKIFYHIHGNLCSASVPVSIDQCCKENIFKHGDWILMPTVGAGMAWGTATYRWKQ